MEGYNSRKPPSVRVTVLEDPNNSLQELFNPASQKNSIPLIQRKLPKSFFVPPSGIPEPVRVSQFTSMQPNDSVTNDLIISHNKTNSSPACLDSAICANLVSTAPNHGHQKSLDIAAKYNRGYAHELAFENLCNSGFIRGNSDSQDQLQTSCIKLEYEVSELPAEFELAINENKQVYFLNHQTQATTWFDPRIPEEFQKWGMTLEELQQVHINYACQFPCGSPVGLAHPNAQIERMSQGNDSSGSPCSGSVTSAAVGRGPGCLPANVSPAISVVSPVNSSTLTPALAVLCSVSSPSSLSPNVSTGPSNSQMRMNSQTLSQPKCRAHTTHMSHGHSHKREQPVQAEIQHHRQHSHGHPAPSQVEIDSLVAHFRSCSQPVSMSTGTDGIGVPGLANLSTASTQSPNSATHGHMGSAACGLSASSSLIGLSVASSPAGQIAGSTNSQTTQLGSGNKVNSSSGQLVQGLECLRLNTSNSPGATLGSPGHVIDVQQQQQQHPKQQRLQHPQFMLQTNTGLGVSPLATGTPSTGCTRFTGATPVSGTQHSHQGSMDSGVGPSLAGQSSASANQTPEHTIMLFCDPSLSECGAEHMEGIAYPNEEFGVSAYNVFDNIDISDISA